MYIRIQSSNSRGLLLVPQTLPYLNKQYRTEVHFSSLAVVYQPAPDSCALFPNNNNQAREQPELIRQCTVISGDACK